MSDRTEADDRPSTDVVYGDAGSHQLKGFDEPVELVELRRPGA